MIFRVEYDIQASNIEEVEADSPEEAIKKVKAGEGRIVDQNTDSDYPSNWQVRED